VLRSAIGQGAAIGVLLPLFALYHGLDRLQVLGTAAGGTVLLLLRLHSDALWLPVSYYWSWNVCHTTLFSPMEAVPTLRPLAAHGPQLWVGRPREAEPELLSILIHLTIALLVWMRMRHGD
jgi:membrane protease YdiL (CAAX protease family)